MDIIVVVYVPSEITNIFFDGRINQSYFDTLASTVIYNNGEYVQTYIIILCCDIIAFLFISLCLYSIQQSKHYGSRPRKIMFTACFMFWLFIIQDIAQQGSYLLIYFCRIPLTSRACNAIRLFVFNVGFIDQPLIDVLDRFLYVVYKIEVKFKYIVDYPFYSVYFGKILLSKVVVVILLYLTNKQLNQSITELAKHQDKIGHKDGFYHDAKHLRCYLTFNLLPFLFMIPSAITVILQIAIQYYNQTLWQICFSGFRFGLLSSWILAAFTVKPLRNSILDVKKSIMKENAVAAAPNETSSNIRTIVI